MFLHKASSWKKETSIKLCSKWTWELWYSRFRCFVRHTPLVGVLPTCKFPFSLLIFIEFYSFPEFWKCLCWWPGSHCLSACRNVPGAQLKAPAPQPFSRRHLSLPARPPCPAVPGRNTVPWQCIHTPPSNVSSLHTENATNPSFWIML